MGVTCTYGYLTRANLKHLGAGTQGRKNLGFEGLQTWQWEYLVRQAHMASVCPASRLAEVHMAPHGWMASGACKPLG